MRVSPCSGETSFVQKDVCFGASESWDSFTGNKALGTEEKTWW